MRNEGLSPRSLVLVLCLAGGAVLAAPAEAADGSAWMAPVEEPRGPAPEGRIETVAVPDSLSHAGKEKGSAVPVVALVETMVHLLAALGGLPVLF